MRMMRLSEMNKHMAQRGGQGVPHNSIKTKEQKGGAYSLLKINKKEVSDGGK